MVKALKVAPIININQIETKITILISRVNREAVNRVGFGLIPKFKLPKFLPSLIKGIIISVI